MAMVACNSNDEGGLTPQNSNEVKFGSITSRAAAVESLQTGDDIYIAATNNIAQVETLAAENQYSVTAANGIESTDPIFWTEDVLSFYAINQQLGVNASDAMLLDYDITTADDELLWVSLFDKNRSDNQTTPIAIAFERCLSEMEINITFKGLYEFVNPDLEFYVKANTSLSFEPWGDTFVAQNVAGRPEDDTYATTWSKTTASNSTQHVLLAIPQTVDAASDIKLVIKDSEGDIEKDITATATAITLASGYRTKVNITIDKEVDSAVIDITSVDVVDFEQADIADEDELIIPDHQ